MNRHRLLSLIALIAYAQASVVAIHACLTTTQDGSIVLESHYEHFRKWHLGGADDDGRAGLRDGDDGLEYSSLHSHSTFVDGAGAASARKSTLLPPPPPTTTTPTVDGLFAATSPVADVFSNRRSEPPPDAAHRERYAAHASLILLV